MKDFDLIFPAFGNEYFGNEYEYLKQFCDIDKYFIKAKDAVSLDLNLLNNYKNGLFPDELQSQFYCYIYSCIISDILKNYKININYTTCYSMGIYAMLYSCSSISFIDGLILIKKVYDLMREYSKNEKYGLIVISGLEEKDIILLLDSNKYDIEIINTNNKLSHTLIGKYDHIEQLSIKAKEEGAINAKFIPIDAPYHLGFMKKAADIFKDYLKNSKIYDSKIKIISSIDQRIVTRKEDIIEDLYYNLFHKINWLKTFTTLLSYNSCNIIECGAGKGLSKICKFIEGNYKIYPFNKIFELDFNTGSF